MQVDPQRIDFRGTAGRINGQAQITISNRGGLPLHVSAPRINQKPTFFSLQGDCSSAPIPPGRACALIVQLASPQSEGFRTFSAAGWAGGNAAGSIELTSDGGQATVPVTASIQPAERPSVSLSPPRLELVSGTPSVITVSNTGRVPAQIQNFGTSAPNQFIVTTAGTQRPCDRGMQLAPGASCQIGIMWRFVPKASPVATFQLADDAADSPQQVALFGRASAPPPPPPATGQLAVEPRSIEFSGYLGNVRNMVPLQITNRGNGPMRLNPPAVNGGRFFAVMGNCSGGPIPPGRGCTLNVRLTLAGTGKAMGSITLSGDGGTIQVPVLVNVTQPPIR